MGPVRISALEAEWQRRATAAAIAAARKVVADGALPSGTPIGRLSDAEWGWVVAAVLFAWIKTRAEQATSEGLDVETTIRMAGYAPDPWDAGAVSTILPELAEAVAIDWSKPLSDWSPEAMIDFLLAAFTLIRKATVVRDITCPGPKKPNAHVTARETNAIAGNGLLAPDEFNDPLI
jgi:hypothetical protein